jgi:hypothetical protein
MHTPELRPLRRPSPDQAHRTLAAARLFDRLAGYGVAFVGSIPLDVHNPGADADIVCSAEDLDSLAESLETHYGACDGFHTRLGRMHATPTLTARFELGPLPVEVFAQPRPVAVQEAFVHFDIESRLLRLHGGYLRRYIRGLKAEGVDTETAFAHVFRLDGEPHDRLYRLASASDRELAELAPCIRPSG